MLPLLLHYHGGGPRDIHTVSSISTICCWCIDDSVTATIWANSIIPLFDMTHSAVWLQSMGVCALSVALKLPSHTVSKARPMQARHPPCSPHLPLRRAPARCNLPPRLQIKPPAEQIKRMTRRQMLWPSRIGLLGMTEMQRRGQRSLMIRVTTLKLTATPGCPKR